MWVDLQEIFYITVGPFFYYVFLPVVVAAGVLLAFYLPRDKR